MGSREQGRPNAGTRPAGQVFQNTARPGQFEAGAASGRGPIERAVPGNALEDVIGRLHDEADFLYSQRQYAESEIKVVQLLGVLERAVGRRHPDFALGLSMRAELRFLVGDPDGAEQLFREALEIRRATIGEHHPDFATSLGCLAGLLAHKGRYDEAEANLRQAHAIRLEVFGEQHPETVRGRNELARLLRRKGDWGVACELIHQTTQTSRPVPGAKSSILVTELAHEVVGLAEQIKQLGNHSGPVAVMDLRSGSPVQTTALDEMSACRRLLASLREKAKRLAGPQPPLSLNAENLHEVAAFLDEVQEAKSRQVAREEIRRRALTVLDQILALGHVGDVDFTPLMECQEHARLLRGGIALAPWANLPSQASTLSSGEHALTQLLSLVVQFEALSDEEWASQHEFVRDTIGPEIATAASRRRLRLKSAPVRAMVRDIPFEEDMPNAPIFGSIEALDTERPHIQRVQEFYEEPREPEPASEPEPMMPDEPQLEKLEIVFSVNESQGIDAGTTNPIRMTLMDTSDRETYAEVDPLQALATDLVVAGASLAEAENSETQEPASSEEEVSSLDIEAPPTDGADFIPNGASVDVGARTTGITAPSFSRVPYRRVGPGFVAGPLPMLKPIQPEMKDGRPLLDPAAPPPSDSRHSKTVTVKVESIDPELT